jgi:hypothetical protein
MAETSADQRPRSAAGALVSQRSLRRTVVDAASPPPTFTSASKQQHAHLGSRFVEFDPDPEVHQQPAPANDERSLHPASAPLLTGRQVSRAPSFKSNPSAAVSLGGASTAGGASQSGSTASGALPRTLPRSAFVAGTRPSAVPPLHGLPGGSFIFNNQQRVAMAAAASSGGGRSSTAITPRGILSHRSVFPAQLSKLPPSLQPAFSYGLDDTSLNSL